MWFPFWASSGNTPYSRVQGANMGPIWGRQDPGGPHVGPVNFVVWDVMEKLSYSTPQNYVAILNISNI